MPELLQKVAVIFVFTEHDFIVVGAIVDVVVLIWKEFHNDLAK